MEVWVSRGLSDKFTQAEKPATSCFLPYFAQILAPYGFFMCLSPRQICILNGEAANAIEIRVVRL
jgi:hypothetical protein